MRKVRVSFRAIHYYRTLGGTEVCPHSHTYTVDVECRGNCDEVERILRDVANNLKGRLINDWEGLVYPEPTTENLALSLFSLLPEGKVARVSVKEDDTVLSVYDGESVWVVLIDDREDRTARVGVKGEFNAMGFAADLGELKEHVSDG